jgi:hypothetical protein
MCFSHNARIVDQIRGVVFVVRSAPTLATELRSCGGAAHPFRLLLRRGYATFV